MTIQAITIAAALALGVGLGAHPTASADDEREVHYFCCDATDSDGDDDRGFGCDLVTAAEADKCAREVLECHDSWTWSKRPTNVVHCSRLK